jgi:predicted ATP-dependent endonuclease of OLD family
MYFTQYPILVKIKQEFNYVYLALNRASSLYENEDSIFYIRGSLSEDIILEPEFVTPEIKYIENLIARQYMLATAQINKINDEFRNSILKSALNLNIQTDLRKAIKTFRNKMMNRSDIIKTQDSYIKLLNSLNLISNEEKIQYEEFFKKYLNRINEIINNNNNDNDDFFNLILESNEMKKIDAILDISADSESRKTAVMKSINLFLNTVNEFIFSADIKKKIAIDVSGHVYFSTENDEQKLSIQYLSSGERQILVFFANLIFGVKPTSSGIFVVDEPELSLHLSWQKVFVKKALEISKNVQFIFATHAPEIIGKYRDRTKKLERSS